MTSEFTVLGFLLKNPKSLIVASEKIRPEYFTNKTLKVFFNVLIKAHLKKLVVNYSVLDLMLRKRKYKKDYYETYSELLNYDNKDSNEFQYALKQMIRSYRKRLLVESVTNASQELLSDDVKKAENELKNVMRTIEMTKLEGDGLLLNIRKNVDESKQLYEEIEKFVKTGENDEHERIKTGINFIDAITGGGARGELWIWGGHTGDGKTHMSKEIAYRACTDYRKNILFVSLEMSVSEVKNMVEIRHSHRFTNGGLLTKRLELGTFSENEKKIYYKTLNDWNKNQKYGKFILWSPPYGCTVEQFALKLEQISYKTDLHMVVVDYGELLALGTFSRDEHRIQVKHKMEQLKDVARTFCNNRGIWIFSPHQISRGGKEKAVKRGYYTLSDLAESAGVERTANLVGWSLITSDLHEEGKLKIGISKYRTGRKDENGVELMADFAHSLITEIDQVVEFDESQLT